MVSEKGIIIIHKCYLNCDYLAVDEESISEKGLHVVRNFIPLVEGYFTMVAQRRDGQCVEIPKLVPETVQECEWYQRSESNST